jgi:L-iditol 2-dehydrogenase
MVEPLSVGIHAVERTGGVEGQKVLIIGAGTIGLSALMAAVNLGAAEVTVCDPLSYRLDIARKLGASYVTGPDELDILAWSREVTKGHGFDSVIECVGSESALQSAVQTVRKGGTVVVVGVYGDPAVTPMGIVQDREISIIGSLMYVRSDCEKALELIASGKAPVGELITHEFPLSEVVEAFRLLSVDEDDKIKVIINIGSD